MNSYGYTPISASQALANTQGVFVGTFGGTTNLNPTSINGIFIQQCTNIAINVNSVTALLYGGLYNPNIAFGIWLDSLCAWNSINRRAAVSSVVTVQITGLSGVVIPINSQILNTNGDVFYNQVAITIASNGTATGIFYSLVTDAISCDAGTVNRIVQQLSGWDTVNNSANGVLGAPQQTDADLRYTRTYSLAQNSTATQPAIIAACYEESTITNFYYIQNNTASSVVANGLTVPAYGQVLVTYGGSDATIANILYTKKSGGSVMGGNTTAMIVDPKYPWATFTAAWQVATPTAIEVDISIKNLSTYPANIIQLIQEAVVANFYGTDGINAFVQIGVTMYASRFIPTLALLGVTQVLSCLTCVISGSPATTLLLPSTQVPTLATTNVNVTLV